jgi:hypothetical protein
MRRGWITEMKGKGIDGEVLVNDARAMIAKHTGAPNCAGLI